MQSFLFIIITVSAVVFVTDDGSSGGRVQAVFSGIQSTSLSVLDDCLNKPERDQYSNTDVMKSQEAQKHLNCAQKNLCVQTV